MVINFLKKNKVGAIVAGVAYGLAVFKSNLAVASDIFNSLGFSSDLGVGFLIIDFLVVIFAGAYLQTLIEKR